MFRLAAAVLLGLAALVSGCSVIYTTLARGIVLEDGSYIILQYGRIVRRPAGSAAWAGLDGIERQDFYRYFPDGRYRHLGTEVLTDADPAYPPGIGVYDEAQRQRIAELARRTRESLDLPIGRDGRFAGDVATAVAIVTGQEPREIETQGALIFPAPGPGVLPLGEDAPPIEASFAHRVDHDGKMFVVIRDRVDDGQVLRDVRTTGVHVYQFTADGRYRHLGTWHGPESRSYIYERGLGVYSEADRQLVDDVLAVWQRDINGSLIEQEGLAVADPATAVLNLTGRRARLIESPGRLIYAVPTPVPTPVPETTSFGGIDDTQGD